MKKTALASILLSTAMALLFSACVKEGRKIVKVSIETSKGTIVAELDKDKAPVTVENFLTYTNEGFFSSTVFHRVISNFMIQGGGMTADLKSKKTHESIINEADNGLKNLKGTLAMARTNDVDSATSQFFINLADNDFLDFRDKSSQGFGYAVFGKVVEGMDVVDSIAKVPTGRTGMFDDVPTETVTIDKVEVVQ